MTNKMTQPKKTDEDVVRWLMPSRCYHTYDKKGDYSFVGVRNERVENPCVKCGNKEKNPSLTLEFMLEGLMERAFTTIKFSKFNDIDVICHVYPDTVHSGFMGCNKDKTTALRLAIEGLIEQEKALTKKED